jgi:exoribonuclease R
VRVWYAIADVAAFVAEGGAIATESLERGVTLYAPDGRASLHPEVLSEGAASLLPDGDRPALLWRIDLDSDGIMTDAEVVRAWVRSRAKLSYRDVQQDIDGGSAATQLRLLRRIGLSRLEVEADRGGVSLNLPSQEVVAVADGFELHYDQTLPVERWNAQVSLLTGMAAAELMVDAGVGLLRTLPPAPDDVLRSLRKSAQTLDIPWADDQTYADAVRELGPDQPTHAAFLAVAVRALRGAGYVTFDGEVPEHHQHAAIAAPYAHVTAPLRRVVDRYAGEIALAICGGGRPPDWVMNEREDLPSVMGRARSRESALDRNVVDLTEALILEPEVGRRFDAVLTVIDREGRATIQLRRPAVIAALDDPGPAEPGDELTVELTAADPEARRVTFRH